MAHQPMQKLFKRASFSLLMSVAIFSLKKQSVSAWSPNHHHAAKKSLRINSFICYEVPRMEGQSSSTERLRHNVNRRNVIKNIVTGSSILSLVPSMRIEPALAYTPDSDKLRESLYLMSRVQEATVQQERFVNRASKQEDLKGKMKLTLRLVEKNYRLLDQITFASNYVTPSDKVVEATTAGYEAAEALQNAIDYVNTLRQGPFEKGQKEFLTSNLQECRERLFDFLYYMPQTKLEEARKRVEEENVANRDEFDGDSDAGVYNPVVLPWKNRQS